MRLLIFTPFYPPHIGGLETHALEFNQHLAPLVDHITVFTPRLPTSAPVHETNNNITIIRFPAFEPVHNYPLPKFWSVDFWRLWHEALSGQPTYVLSRTRFFFTSLMAWRVARKYALPWLHVEHGSDFAHFHSPLKSLIGKLYDWTCGRFVLRRADILVANSAASAMFVSKLSGRNDCRTIYRGVEVDMIQQAVATDEIALRFPNRVIVGYLGRLIDGKGVRHLLEAVKQLGDNRLACIIIGSGPERKRLEEFIEKNHLSSSVALLGHRPLPEALGLMKSFDIFVNPSYSEGIPTSVIEAALLKKAIIATRVGGTPEIISGDGDGFLIPSQDTTVIMEKLKLLTNDQSLRRMMGERAALAAEDKFSWPRAIKQYCELFEKRKNNPSER